MINLILEVFSEAFLPLLFVGGAYVLSKTTTPPHCETWEEIQSKIDNQSK